ncbi:hypothetical protein PY32053_00641 [Paracoccus yeei]|uniref:Uncharacterized protein n=1 Tax=Paracoccus yeei TaxID=147645 RepID=A0A386UIY6_9RHOB|nr:hypothetical protein PY32053_00641 [Paracoccus yeei]
MACVNLISLLTRRPTPVRVLRVSLRPLRHTGASGTGRAAGVRPHWTFGSAREMGNCQTNP